MSTMYRKVGLICAAAATAAVLSAMPISVERSATSGIVVSVGQAQAYYGHHRRVAHRHVRRAYHERNSRCAVLCFGNFHRQQLYGYRDLYCATCAESCGRSPSALPNLHD